MRHKGTIFLCTIVFIISLVLQSLEINSVNAIGTDFMPTWERVDRPVREIPGVGRGYTWGPDLKVTKPVISELYNGSLRKVQYLDKARMEVNNPKGSTSDLFYVTTGLLVKELVTGFRQDGDNSFAKLTPSNIQVAGDPNVGGVNQVAPTYSSFKNVITFVGTENSGTNAVGKVIRERIDRAGTIITITPPESRTYTAYDSVTRHNVADVFVEFGNQLGLVWNGKSYVQGFIFFGNPTYVLGRPVTEAYWCRAVVAGSEKYVLVQMFERRVLTYTPSNPAGFKVEAGNVGQHYYRWRYEESTTPTPAPILTPVPTPTPLSTPAEAGIDFGANALLNVQNLPQLGAYTQSLQVSSRDPEGGNYDRGNYLYKDGSKFVLLDAKGAGAVYRMWMTASNIEAVGRIQFYFDDEPNPRVDYPVTDFFSGKKAPFLLPLVGGATVSSGGYFSYVPIPFARHLKIVTTGKPDYYQIDYQKLAGSQKITSFTGTENYSKLTTLFNNTGTDPKPINPGRQIIKGSGDLRPNGELSLGSALKGPAVISYIKLKITSTDPRVFSRTSLKIKWDNRPWSQVDAPLDFFFGSGRGEKRVAGIMTGINPDTHQYYAYFPMPFRVNANISLTTGGDNFGKVEWEIALDPDVNGSLVNGNTGYFNATFKRQFQPAAGKDYNALTVKGRGRYVGMVSNIYSHYSAMEGDVRFYIDKSATPQFLGTGFEDYFNGGFGFYYGPFTLPLHGSAAQSQRFSGDFISLVGYRFHLGDAISFNTGLEVNIEHGFLGSNESIPGEEYSSLVYWYSMDGDAFEETDTVDVGNSSSETLHNYSATRKVFSGGLHSPYEGSRDNDLVDDTGHKIAGISEFTIRVNPDNVGVILRRRFDYNESNQQANVYVDGQLVGRWYSPGQNQIKRWREEDFVIPIFFTKNKNNLRVRIEVVLDPTIWGEFYYTVFSLKPAISYLPGSSTP